MIDLHILRRNRKLIADSSIVELSIPLETGQIKGLLHQGNRNLMGVVAHLATNKKGRTLRPGLLLDIKHSAY